MTEKIILAIFCFICGSLTGAEIVRQMFMKAYRKEKDDVPFSCKPSNDEVLHAIECECDKCTAQWKALEGK